MLDGQELEEKARHHFGETWDIRHAGYILTNGTLLDFQGDRYAPGRVIDHREVSQLFEGDDDPGFESGTEYMQEFIRQTGAIRNKPEGPGFELLEGQRVTRAQLRSLATGYIAAFPRGSTLDVDVICDMNEYVNGAIEIDQLTADQLDDLIAELYERCPRPKSQRSGDNPIDAMVRYFGITDNFLEAAYVLPDGRMLDFTGRQDDMRYRWNEGLQRFTIDERFDFEEDTLAGELTRDHDDLLKAPHSFTGDVEDLCEELGVISIDGCSGVEMYRAPTVEQSDVLVSMANFCRDRMWRSGQGHKGFRVSFGTLTDDDIKWESVDLDLGNLAIADEVREAICRHYGTCSCADGLEPCEE